MRRREGKLKLGEMLKTTSSREKTLEKKTFSGRKLPIRYHYKMFLEVFLVRRKRLQEALNGDDKQNAQSEIVKVSRGKCKQSFPSSLAPPPASFM